MSSAGPQPSVQLGDSDVLYEDRWVIAFAKPSGLPTQGTRDPSRDHLLAAAERWMQRRGGDNDPYLALHHRLDVGTSGVVVMAKHRKANKGLAEAFRARTAAKVYLAVVATDGDVGLPEVGERWTVTNHLARDPTVSRNRPAQMVAVHAGGDYAETHFELLARRVAPAPGLPGVGLVRAAPRTGRRHQIRAHLRSRGLPIVGDRRYGGARELPIPPSTKSDTLDWSEPPRMMLHALAIELPHPVTGESLAIRCEPPSAWQDWCREVGLSE